MGPWQVPHVLGVDKSYDINSYNFKPLGIRITFHDDGDPYRFGTSQTTQSAFSHFSFSFDFELMFESLCAWESI